MKKYVKPDLYYENFELSQHVATCAFDMPESSDPANCYAITDDHASLGEGWKVFLNANVCEFWDVEEYCYTNGSISNSIFNS